MNTTLHTATLNPFERALVRRFEDYIRKTYGMSLATYLLLELEDGHATVLDRKSVDYKVMTRWQ
jgi:hypothetical protein